MKNNTISVIGSACIDISGAAENRQSFRLYDSIKGNISVSCGGVGRNVAENLALFGMKPTLICALAEDSKASYIRDDASKKNIQIEPILVRNQSTAMFMSIADRNGDMISGIDDMAINDAITIKDIESRRRTIEASEYCVIDANVPKDVISYTLHKFPNQRFIVDPVSVTNAARLGTDLAGIWAIKPNRHEAEAMTGIKIANLCDAYRACLTMLKMGAKNVFLSLDVDGAVYMNERTGGHAQRINANVVNAVGAGDSFVAAIAYGFSHKMDIKEIAEFGMRVAARTVASKSTVSPDVGLAVSR